MKPKYKIGDKIPIEFVVESRPDFDYACSQAYQSALGYFGFRDGHGLNVEGFERSCCSVHVRFVGYTQVGHMLDSNYNYNFEAWTEKNREYDDD